MFVSDHKLAKQIIREVNHLIGFNIRAHRRDRVAVEARIAAIQLIRNQTDLSYPLIGDELDRDHTSIVYLNKKPTNNRIEGIKNHVREQLLLHVNHKDIHRVFPRIYGITDANVA